MGRSKRKVCGNCNNYYIDGDKYCRYCGAPLGRPEFIDEDFATIYGPPPIKRVHTCDNCGYSWETEMMIDRQIFCPECGGSAPGKGDEGCMMR